MAPEQTGRMNRSIDFRSDLYALGVTFYEMLTGELPFAASDPMEWVHCHIARQPAPLGERFAGVPAPLSAIVMKLLAKNAEDRYQTAAGLAVDLRKCRTEWERNRQHRAVPARLRRCAGPTAHPGEALRPGARDRHAARAPSTGSWPTARRNSCSCPAIPASASLRWSTNCTRRSSRRAACSRRASSTSTSATSPTPPWPRPSAVWCGPLLGESEAELGRWRDALSEALGPNGQLIVNLDSRAGARDRDTAAGRGLAAAGREEPFSDGFPALPRRLRAQGAPAGAVP